ncbi:MAG: protoglobin domain-containing protein [Myxococcota bacterium]
MGVVLADRTALGGVPGETSFEEMKRYVRFDASDADRLRRLAVVARPHFGQLATEFYERAREHEDAHRVFSGEDQIRRLHAVQVAWLERLLSGPHNEDYARKSRRIGRVHVRVGLPERYVFVGVTVFRAGLKAIIESDLPDDKGATVRSLAKILDIELALMNGAYREAMNMRQETLEREVRRKMVGAVERSGRRHVRAVQVAGAIIVGLEDDGTVQIFNREAERVTGQSWSEVRGKHFRDLFVPADDQDAFDATWEAARNAPGPVLLPITFAIRVRSGRLRTMAGHLSRTPDEPGDDGNGPGGATTILTGNDVTEERALGLRVRQSERLAAVGTLAAGLAHEIRNPLNGAKLHLTFLHRAMAKSGDVNPDFDDAVEVVRGEIDRLSSLVNEFLDFARPKRLDRKPVVVQDLVRRVVRLVEVDPAQTELVLELPERDLIADIDAPKIEQVLLNLIRNAVDAATENAGGTVRCVLYRRPRDVVIEVHDDGPGFPAEAPIFDAFYSTKDRGTGMGLSICHRILQDHGGEIRAASRPGQTVFTVVLPLEDPTQTGASMAEPEGAPRRGGT